MDDKQQAGAVEPLQAPSRLAALGWGLTAILSQFALVDIAIETFWSGSPIRWWVAPPVLVFVALGVWLWRPGGWAAKRWGWEGAASWSIGALLVLLAVTAWLPGGNTNGVRLLLQPTATLLTSAIAAAVVLAAVVLFRALAVLPSTARMVARGVLMALAIYALASLCVALYDRAPFTTLFQGGAAWQRLPRWLQGSFIGAFALLPLALLGQAVRAVDHLRRRQSVRVLLHQATAMVMAVVMAVSGVYLPVSRNEGRGASPRGAAASADSAYSESRNELLRLLAGQQISGQAASPAEGERRLAEMFGAFKALTARLPRATFDVAAVVERVGREPSALFEWVRDRTYWVPYEGSLRGPTGVLMDRLGNSLDRSLLLAALLKGAGRNARLAHATLPEETARIVKERSTPVPENPTSLEDIDGLAQEQSLREVAVKFQTDASRLQTAFKKSRDAAAKFGETVTMQAERQAAVLLKSVSGRAAIRDDDPARSAADHWWVQIGGGDSWTDLDPSLPDSRVGVRLAAPTETVQPERLPAAVQHSVEISVVVERVAAGKAEQRVALSHTLRPSEVFGQSVALTHVPLSAQAPTGAVRLGDLVGYLRETAAKERRWLPVLHVGDAAKLGKVVLTDGRMVELSASASGQIAADRSKSMGGMAGLLGGGEDNSSPETPGEWSAEWLEYRIHVPGQPSRTLRRQIFDTLEDSARRAQPPLPPTSDDRRLQRSLALLGTTDILLLPCALSPEFVASLKANLFLANGDLGRRFGRGGGASQDELLEFAERLQGFPAPLYDLALARHALSPVRRSVYVAAPNILSLHRGISSLTPDTLKAFTAVDIVANDVAVHARAGVTPFEARLRQGTHDTNAEAFVLSDRCCGVGAKGPAPAFMAAITSGTPWVTLSTPADLPRLQLPPDANSRIRDDLSAGYLVVAPANGLGGDVAWWRIDPRTGATLGIGRTGWGEGLAEWVIMKWKDAAAYIHASRWAMCIAKITIIVACFLVWGTEYLTHPDDGGAGQLGMLVCEVLTAVGFVAASFGAEIVAFLALIAELLWDIYELYHSIHATATRYE